MKIFFVILLLSGAVFAQNYSCLPKDTNESDVVSAKSTNNKVEKITIKQTLKKMKAKCSKGKLVDGKKREIRFYNLQGCWGNPPQDYLEIMENQQKEIAEMKKKYTVVEISCNPSGVPIQ